MENFQKLIAQYTEKRGFVPNSNSALWRSALAKFNLHSEWFKSVMGYAYFEKLIG